MTHRQYGAVQHNHNASMVIVQCNMADTQYGAVQHNHNASMVIDQRGCEVVGRGGKRNPFKQYEPPQKQRNTMTK